MKIPKDDGKRLDTYRELVQQCLSSRAKRIEQYSQNRRWYLYGSNEGASPWNKVYSHLDQVRSFLYASDSTRFSTRLSAGASDFDYSCSAALSRRINESWKKNNADNMVQIAVLWSLVYATTFVKLLRRRGGGPDPYVVDPGTFGVLEENVPMLDRQEAFTQVYYITKDALDRSLALHPKRAEIMKDVTAVDQTTATSNDNMGSMVRDIIVTSQAVGGVGMPNVAGMAPTPMNSSDGAIIPEYAPEVEVPLIEMTELWVWNDTEDDYQIVTMAGQSADKRSIIYDRQNVYLPRRKDAEGEHPFVQFCPNPMYDYFWGAAEVDKLSLLQERRNHRMQQIDVILDKQASPPGAWGGMGLSEEKFAAFNEPGAQIAAEELRDYKTFVPPMPADLYQSISQNDRDFDEASGLPNTVQGKGESGVRSAGHAGKLLTVGSSRAKARANVIEDSLEKAATLYGKCLYVDDPHELKNDQGEEFVIAQMTPNFTVEVDAHSNSPVFMESNRELAGTLLKAGLITPERFLEMTSPPMLDELLRDYKEKIAPAKAKAAQERNAALAQGQSTKDKPNLQSVG